MLAGDAPEILDETLGCLGHVQHLGVTVQLGPGTVPVIGEHEHGGPYGQGYGGAAASYSQASFPRIEASSSRVETVISGAVKYPG